MSAQGTIKRYSLLIEKISSSQHPSFQVLKNYLHDHGFEISERTLQRNIEQIRDEFGIEIKYNRLKNGYFIDRDESINVDSFLRFLEIVGTANLLTESLKDGRGTLNYISFESQGNLKGIEHLKALLFAIRNSRKIEFTHRNFETGKARKYKMKPYLLKEYQNRWYAVGLLSGFQKLMTFGIDRIEDLKVLAENFTRDESINPQKYFENVIGVTASSEKPEEIILSFTPLQGEYVKALPLHHSQETIRETKKEVVIKITVVPTYELEQKILMMGDRVRVVKPEWLRDEIKNILSGIIKKY